MTDILASFASDNYSGVCQEAMLAIQMANSGPAPAYGNDLYTKTAADLIKKELGKKIEVFFVFNGSGANISGLRAITRSIHSIVCAQTAHIATQETGAVFNHTGCKLLLIPSSDGKISAGAVREAVEKERYWGKHATQPKVVSISLPTEYGTIYTIKELKEIAKACKELDLLFHIDGCRLYNAAVALDCSLKELTADVGVDVLSLGGTKNGLLAAEAVVFFNPSLAVDFPHIHKQSLQLASKMRFISAQYIPFFEEKIWKKNAENANRMTQLLAKGLKNLPKVHFSQKVESNQIFVKLPKKAIEALQKNFLFHVWDAKEGEIRLITSFDTTEKEVEAFISHAKKAIK